MKKLTKILCLVLLVFVLAFSVIACNESTGNDGGNQGGNTKTQTYTVKYLNGDNVIYSTTVDEGETLKTYSPNTQEGYVFEGWYLDADFTESFKAGTEVNKNLTLYGKFTFKSFTVTFVDYDGTELAVRENVAYGTPATAPDTSTLGDKFKGWDTDFSAVGKNLTVKATYNDVTVTFLYADGSEILSTEVPVGTNILSNDDYIYAAGQAESDLSSEFTFNKLVADVELKDGKYITPEDVTFSPSLSLVAPKELYSMHDGARKDTFDGNYPLARGNSFKFGFTRPSNAKLTYTETCTVNGQPATLTNGELDFSDFTPGTHTVVYTVTASYGDLKPVSSSKTVTIIIQSSAIAETLLGASDFTHTYDGAAHGLTVEAEKEEGYVVLYSENADGEFTTTKPLFTNAGTYYVYYKVTREHCADSDIKQCAVSIAKREVTITPDKPADIHYGDVLLKASLTYTLSYQNLIGVTVSCNASYTQGSPVGTYKVTAEVIGTEEAKANYKFDPKETEFTVTQRPITVTVSGSKDYDGYVWKGDFTVSGLAQNYTAQGSATTISVINGTYTNANDFNTGKLAVRDVNNADVTDQHVATYVYDVTINVGDFPITAEGLETVYNDSDYRIPAVTSSIADYSVYYSLNGTDYVSDIPVLRNAGEHTVYYKVTDANNVLQDQYGTVVLKISKASVTVKADAMTVVYGDAIPEYTATYSLYGADTLDSLTFDCVYIPGSNIGNYTITPVASDINYDITHETATLTVTARPVTVTANDVRVTYGDEAPEYSASYTLFGTDTVTVTFSCDYVKGSDAGEYQIAPSGAHNNYSFSLVNGTLTVDRKSATITANNASVTYGDSAPTTEQGKTTYAGSVVTGLEQNDSVEVSYTSAYAKGSDIGTYDIVPSATHKNYTFTCINGTLTVNKKTISVEIKDEKFYDGYVWSKTFSELDGLLENERPYGTVIVPEKTEDNGTEAGTYVNADDFNWTESFKIMHGKTDSTSNYDITFTYNVVIKKVSFLIRAQDVNVVYDGNAYAPEALTIIDTIDGNKVDVTDKTTISYSETYADNGDGYTSDIPSYSSAGEHVIYYRVIYKEQPFEGTITITIARKQATVTLYDHTITYGEKAPAFTSDIEGILEADKANVRVYLACPTYAQGYGVGTYPISCSFGGTASGNYLVTYVNANDEDSSSATLTVVKRAVTITATSYNVTYGDKVPEYSASYTLYGNDSLDITFTSDYTQGSHVGSYTIVPSATDDNYDITFVNGVVSVAKMKVTASISNKTIKFGTDIPDFELTYSLYADDAVTINVLCAYTKGSNRGNYPVTLEVVGDTPDYEFTLETATLTVERRKLNVILSDVSIVYGEEYTLPYTLDTNGYDTVYEADSFAPTANVNEKEMVPSVGKYEITYSANDNYTVKVNQASLTVSQRTASIIWTGNHDNHTYTGSSLKDEVTAHYVAYDGSDVYVSVTFNGANSFEHAGYYELVAIVSDGNYDISGTVSNATIAKGKVTIAKEQTQSYVYTGSAIQFAKEKVIVKFGNTDASTAGVILEDDYSASVAGTYKLTISYSTSDLESDNSVYAYLKICGVQIGDDGDWYTIEDALKAATSGQTIYVRTDTSFAAADITEALYAGNDYHTVKSGVILRLPSVDDTKGVGSPTYCPSENDLGYAPSERNYYVDTNSAYIQEKLTVPAHVTLNVQGTILLNGELGNPSTVKNGQTTGIHGQLINNGTINVASGATVDARGFVKGTGTLTFNSGAKAYSPFVVLDYRGGTNTATVFNKGNISPFNQWEMPNFQCTTVFEYGSTHIAYLDLYATKQHNTDQMEVISAQKGLLIMSEGSRITTTYNRSAGITTLKMVGNVTLGTLTLQIKQVVEVTVKLSDIQFPIPWTYNIIVGDGSTATTFNVGYALKLMTGFNCTVEKNATVNVTGNVIIYESFTNTFSSEWTGGRNNVYPSKSAAKVTVKGTLNVTGGIAGKIYGANDGKVIIGSSATLALTSSEGDSGKTSSTDVLVAVPVGSGGTYHETSVISETAKLVDANGNVTTVAQGKTYTYTNSAWN